MIWRYTADVGALLTVTLLMASFLDAQKLEPSWLDRPLSNWNTSGRSLTAAPRTDETTAELAKRCDSLVRRDTPGERALANAGWLPFHLFDRQIVQGDVEILGAMADADGMCRPAEFNVFVFVGGQFAGTLSPALMTSRTDGSAGVVRLAADGMIAAQFERYSEKDPLCCPSGRMAVRYRIERKPGAAIVVPVSVQAARL